MNEGFLIIHNICFLLFFIFYYLRFFVLRAVSVVSSTG